VIILSETHPDDQLHIVSGPRRDRRAIHRPEIAKTNGTRRSTGQTPAAHAAPTLGPTVSQPIATLTAAAASLRNIHVQRLCLYRH
jgi:hypothetical protein